VLMESIPTHVNARQDLRAKTATKVSGDCGSSNFPDDCCDDGGGIW
jgi:hypothetical protein